jgi:hypothetical protein
MQEIEMDGRDGRAVLSYDRHPMHGNGWLLWHLDDDVELAFIPGDLDDADDVVREAERILCSTYAA